MTKPEEHLTAFIDLLGMKQAILTADAARTAQIVDFLKKLASMRSDFVKRVEHVDPATRRVFINPAISTFSDAIVLSWRMADFAPDLDPNDPVHAVHNLAVLTGWIAARALSLGFLIRGGSTVGPLYHSAGVASGRALIEAYQLETEIANYPRIAVPTDIATCSAWRGLGEMTRDADDGVYCVDYMLHMVSPFREHGTTNSEISNWFKKICEIVRERLHTYENGHKYRDLQKWTWFAKRFREHLTVGPAEAHNLPIDEFPNV